ncbi:MAG: alpha/beta hydrolase [Acidimicrobiia bacterium]|nr:alpha/beta hydrolase [Acidimicrobiia bacterium]
MSVPLLFAAAACGDQDAALPEAAPTTVPAPATTAAPGQAETPSPEESALPEVTEETVTGPAPAPASAPAPAPAPAETADDITPATSRPAPPSSPADPGDPEETAATGVVPADLEGRWEGAIAIPGPTDLPFTVDLTASGDGLRGTVEIQGAPRLPLSNIVLDAGRLHFELDSPFGLNVWDGEVLNGVIEGEFTQAGMAESFWMQRFEDPSDDEGASFGREEVVFSNGDITLAGELTFPEGDGPHPAVVLISGSFAQDRDSSVGRFRLFAVLANHLAEAGLASLRFDDRGVGGSGGDNLQATLQDRAGDVEAAVEVLRSRDDIAAGSIGLLGHSEGGIVAPVVANRTSVAFVALLAAPVLPLGESLVEQQIALFEQSGATAEEIEGYRALLESVLAAAATGQGWDEAEAAIRAVVRQQFEAMPAQTREAIPDEDAMVDSIVAGEMARWRSPWFESFVKHDPRSAIVALDVPVLALFGELDTQVPAASNSIAMSEAIAESNIPGYTIASIFAANHLFQEAVTGSVNEYARLKREFAPDFVAILTEWLSDYFGER